ncbi:MAG: sulfurtransferase [Chloroflexi bacterium]|nr:MAG: sulfurtransferase [Chloroflexota bacterium]
MYSTLIDCEALQKQFDDSNWVVVDCRFSLAELEWGQTAYQEAHIPGAIYAHLDDDLSGPPVTDNGRHPLPTPDALTAVFSRFGIDSDKQVVVYDHGNGMLAARLWWLLQYMGHTAVSVLDGGWQAWQAAGYPVRTGQETNEPAQFVGELQRDRLVLIDEVPDLPLLVDSRDADRYSGKNETIDPVAGHIPGAVHYFYQENWTKDGRYLAAQQMKAQLQDVIGDIPPEQVTFSCGSGVTACVNLLAMAHAGLGNGRLYVGSWSEWCSDPKRPIATGSE